MRHPVRGDVLAQQAAAKHAGARRGRGAARRGPARNGTRPCKAPCSAAVAGPRAARVPTPAARSWAYYSARRRAGCWRRRGLQEAQQSSRWKSAGSWRLWDCCGQLRLEAEEDCLRSCRPAGRPAAHAAAQAPRLSARSSAAAPAGAALRPLRRCGISNFKPAGGSVRACPVQAVRRRAQPLRQRGLLRQGLDLPLLLLAQPLPRALPGARVWGPRGGGGGGRRRRAGGGGLLSLERGGRTRRPCAPGCRRGSACGEWGRARPRGARSQARARGLRGAAPRCARPRFSVPHHARRAGTGRPLSPRRCRCGAGAGVGEWGGGGVVGRRASQSPAARPAARAPAHAPGRCPPAVLIAPGGPHLVGPVTTAVRPTTSPTAPPPRCRGLCHPGAAKGPPRPAPFPNRAANRSTPHLVGPVTTAVRPAAPPSLHPPTHTSPPCRRHLEASRNLLRLESHPEPCPHLVGPVTTAVRPATSPTISSALGRFHMVSFCAAAWAHGVGASTIRAAACGRMRSGVQRSAQRQLRRGLRSRTHGARSRTCSMGPDT